MLLKTLFVISISTAKIVFPDFPILPETQPGQAPPEVATATKSVSMTLTTSKYTDGIPSVRVDVPEGLGVGEFVKLLVHNNKPPAGQQSPPVTQPKVTGKTYWGCTETIPWGQPKIDEIAPASDPASITGSEAYWPIGYPKEKVAGPKSKPAGKYMLTSNYCGGTSVSVDAGQTYLEPINLLGLKGKVDPAKAIKIKWTRVPNAVGYVVSAFGGNEKETITWTSGSDPAIALDVEHTPVTRDKVESYLAKKILLPPDSTICTIPAGVFKGATDVFVTVTAVGTDKIQRSDDMDTYVLVRSIASIPLKIEVPIEPPAAPVAR